MNDFFEINVKIYSQAAFTMLDNEYVHERQQTCKSRHTIRWNHTISVVLMPFHFIKDFTRMIYLSQA